MRGKRFARYAAALLCLCGGVACAQSPTAEDLARAGTAARDALRRANEAPAAAAPRIPQAPRGTLDVEALARRYQSAAEGAAEDERLASGLLVFVSFSMPPANLRLLAEQAARAGATLVLRGLHRGSLKATAAKVRETLGDNAEGLIVDPRLFDLYRIESVPVFVVAKDDGPAGCVGESCSAAPPHARIAGDVTLEFALRRMAESSDLPTPYLDRLTATVGGR